MIELERIHDSIIRNRQGNSHNESERCEIRSILEKRQESRLNKVSKDRKVAGRLQERRT